MTSPQRPAGRGRPPSITRERIADAGIGIGLLNITFVGVAAALGVSHMALYKHVPSLEALKHLVAEAVFSRWQIPRPDDSGADALQDYLTVFANSARELVKSNPGLTPYVIRRLAATPAMLAKIDDHQSLIARIYGIPKDDARWLLATVAFHGIAVADTVYAAAGKAPAEQEGRVAEVLEMEAELMQGMHALIVGALAVLKSGTRLG